MLEVLEKFDLAKRDDVVRVRSQKVQGKDWAFITMPSVVVVDAVARRSFKLKGTSYYLQKDLSKEARERLKKARLAQRELAKNSLIHPQRQQQIQHPVSTTAPNPNGAVSPEPMAFQQVLQHPNARPVGVPQPRNFNIVARPQVPYHLG